jgi:hypothetical protein
MSRTEALHYELVMRDAKDSVFLVAVRQAIDTRLLVVEFDAGQDPGPHQEHTLTISVRDTSLAVKADSIPHEWLPVSTGFIDTRFSRLVSGQLADLVKKAQKTGKFI